MYSVYRFILSLADVDPKLMMEDESLVWASSDVVIVLQHLNEKIPLRWAKRKNKKVQKQWEACYSGHLNRFWLLISCFCSYVSETERQHAVPSQVQRHILAGIASALGGVSAPYEKTSHAHERPVTNWLWAAGCHPFGPFSNISQMSQMLQDVALVSSVILICESKIPLNSWWISWHMVSLIRRGILFMLGLILLCTKYVKHQR